MPLAGHLVDVYAQVPWLVRGENGETGPIAGHEPMARITVARLAELEEQLRASRTDLDATQRRLRAAQQQLRAASLPLYRKAARRMPWLARPVRPIFHRVRNVIGRPR